MAHQGGLTMGFSSHLVLFIDVKKRFLRFFYFGHLFTLFSKRFLFKKTLAKFRAASRLTRSTFKITAAK